MQYEPIKITKLRAINDHILISNMYFGERTTESGLIIRNDDGKTEGIRPRWGKVFAVGPEQKDIEVGQWILVEHGRWTRKVKIENETGIHEIQKVDNAAILAISDEEPVDDFIGDSI